MHKIKAWCNSDVEVNTLWYYSLLGLMVVDLIGDVCKWLS